MVIGRKRHPSWLVSSDKFSNLVTLIIADENRTIVWIEMLWICGSLWAQERTLPAFIRASEITFSEEMDYVAFWLLAPSADRGRHYCFNFVTGQRLGKQFFTRNPKSSKLSSKFSRTGKLKENLWLSFLRKVIRYQFEKSTGILLAGVCQGSFSLTSFKRSTRSISISVAYMWKTRSAQKCWVWKNVH